MKHIFGATIAAILVVLFAASLVFVFESTRPPQGPQAAAEPTPVPTVAIGLTSVANEPTATPSPQRPTPSVAPTAPVGSRKIAELRGNVFHSLVVSGDGHRAAFVRMVLPTRPFAAPTFPLQIPLTPPTPGPLEYHNFLVIVDATSGRSIYEEELDLAGSISWSPRGDKIAFQLFTNGGRNQTIVTMAPDGTGKKLLLPADAYRHLSGLAWSPSGTQITFVSKEPSSNDPEAQTHLWVMSADGSGLRNVFGGSVKELGGLIGGGPAWFPDAKEILVDFFFRAPIDSGILAVDVETGQRRYLTPGVRAAERQVSPDGRRILFRQWDEGSGIPSIWVMNRDGGGKIELVPRTLEEPRQVMWTLDSRRIIYLSGPPNDQRLWNLDVDSKGKTLLARGTSGAIIDDPVVAGSEVLFFYRVGEVRELRAIKH